MPVAILMPAYNEPGRLAATLAGVFGPRAAAFGGVTVFLVDDGSDPPIDPAAHPHPSPRLPPAPPWSSPATP
jgi:hypothetical protein